MQYKMTQLEEDIKRFYKNMGITSPSQINMYDIASEFEIWIHIRKVESKIYKRNGLYSMFLNEDKSLQERWQDFGHELCHLIKHYGNQEKMNKMFKNLQEYQANNFMYHFCVPTFMLLNYEISNYLNINDGVSFVANTFNVTEEFAKKRLIHFRNQMQQSKSDLEFRAYMNSLYPKTDPEKWTDETKRILKQLNIQLERKKVTV